MLKNGDIVSDTTKLMNLERTIAPSITKLKSAQVPETAGIVICHLKNARDYIPHFLAHYRAIGVKHFAFIDNDSTDGGLDILLGEPDCDVYLCAADFRVSLCGTVWHNAVMTAYQSAAWILNVDIDEFAIYDGWPFLDINTFADRCQLRGLSALPAIMIDMYSEGPIANSPRMSDTKNLIHDFSYFDTDSYTRIVNPEWRKRQFPRPIITGGPSMRAFGDAGQEWLTKTPMLLEPGIIFYDPHTVLPFTLNFFAPLIGLLHFRLNGDLISKIEKVKSLGYAPGSVSTYEKFGQRLNENANFSFMYSGSQKLRDGAQLVELGLIKSPSDLNLFGN